MKTIVWAQVAKYCLIQFVNKESLFRFRGSMSTCQFIIFYSKEIL